jgi:putative transcriptional regulator
MSLLVACHLTYCPACREVVWSLECLCGGLLAEEPPVPAAQDCLARALARLEAPAQAEVRPALPALEAGSPLPAPLRARLGCGAEAIRWNFRLPGLSEYRMEGFGNEAVSMIRARPGVRIPAHTHSGEEATLILAGQMRDGERVFARGDVACADEDDDHRPEIIGSETCLCLVVLSGKLRFTGPFGRALNLLNG